VTATAAGQVVVARHDAAELARVLGVIAEFLTTRPAARASLARFAYPGCDNPYFWTEELLGYLHQTVTDLHQLTHTTNGEAP
jgi:hypothetical protein